MFTAATFGTYTAALGLAQGAMAFAGTVAVGAGIGGSISYAHGGGTADVLAGAWTGAQISTAIGSLSPNAAAWALERTAQGGISAGRYSVQGLSHVETALEQLDPLLMGAIGQRTSLVPKGNLYDVGTYNQLRYNSIEDTIVHHVPSRLRGNELIK